MVLLVLEDLRGGEELGLKVAGQNWALRTVTMDLGSSFFPPLFC